MRMRAVLALFLNIFAALACGGAPYLPITGPVPVQFSPRPVAHQNVRPPELIISLKPDPVAQAQPPANPPDAQAPAEMTPAPATNSAVVSEVFEPIIYSAGPDTNFIAHILGSLPEVPAADFLTPQMFVPFFHSETGSSNIIFAAPPLFIPPPPIVRPPSKATYIVP